MEAYLCFSNLKKVHRQVCKELQFEAMSEIGLAIWEQIKNVEHRVEKTRAFVSVSMNGQGPVVTTRNKVSEEEILRCIDGKCLSGEDLLDLEHLRGETLIIAYIGRENYERYIDPWSHEMITKIHIPQTKTKGR